MIEESPSAPRNLHSPIADHWRIDSKMAKKAITTLREIGMNDAALSRQERLEKMAKLDHFHGGGIQSTEILREMMRIPERAGMRGLDIGCGIGGPMRWFAFKTGTAMEGIDVTSAFVHIGQTVNKDMHMNQCMCRLGDATQIDSKLQYDFEVMMAVSCNIADREALYRSIHDSLAPGGVVGMLDIVKGKTEGLVLPVPWSRDGSQESSMLITFDETVDGAGEAGLMFESGKDISPEVLAWFENEDVEIAQGRPYGFETLVPDWGTMVKSQIENLRKGHIGFSCLVFSKSKE